MQAPGQDQEDQKTKKAKKTKKMKKMKKTKTNIRVATWNLGTLNERDAKVVEMLLRWQVNICGVEEHGFKGPQVRTVMGMECKFKFFCAQAGILLAETWADKVIEVHHIYDRISLLKDKLIIGKAVFTFLSVYAYQVGLSESEKECFYDQLQYLVAKVPATEIHPSWWLEWSCWRSCWCVQRCPRWASL